MVPALQAASAWGSDLFGARVARASNYGQRRSIPRLRHVRQLRHSSSKPTSPPLRPGSGACAHFHRSTGATELRWSPTAATFSEGALIRERFAVEVAWLEHLAALPDLTELQPLSDHGTTMPSTQLGCGVRASGGGLGQEHRGRHQPRCEGG